MATQKEVEVWLSYLQKTMHFESVFSQVLERIVHGEGHGLIIIQGPSKVANKSFFLRMVKAFHKGVTPYTQECFSPDIRRLLAQIDASHYECVDIKEDCPTGASDLYLLPLYLTLPLSLASASEKRGLRKGQRVVVLCNDLQEFLRHNKSEQMVFLGQLAELTGNYKELTFLAAYTLWNSKGLENTALSDYVLRLGYD